MWRAASVPVINDNIHYITISKNFIIENKECVSSIVPLEVTARTGKTESNINKQTINNQCMEIKEWSTSEKEEKDCHRQNQQKVVEKIDLSRLNLIKKTN